MFLFSFVEEDEWYISITIQMQSCPHSALFDNCDESLHIIFRFFSIFFHFCCKLCSFNLFPLILFMLMTSIFAVVYSVIMKQFERSTEQFRFGIFICTKSLPFFQNNKNITNATCTICLDSLSSFFIPHFENQQTFQIILSILFLTTLKRTRYRILGIIMVLNIPVCA